MRHQPSIFVLTLLISLGCCVGISAQSVEWIEPQKTATDASFRGIAVRSQNEVWLGGSQGTLLHTTDAGNNWKRVALPDADGLDFRDIELPAPNVVVVLAAGPAKNSRIYHSSDNGRTWVQALVNQDPDGFYNALTFLDDREALLVGDPINGILDLHRTRDAGKTWKREQGPSLKPGEYGFAASGTNIVAIEKELRIVTGGADARVLLSSDRGETWNSSRTPIHHGNESSGIFSVAFRDRNHGIVVGGDYKDPTADHGNIAVTSDGGLTWSLAQPKGKIDHRACVRHLVGKTWMSVGRTSVALSHDDGHHWQVISEPGFFTFDFDRASRTGFMAGGEGRVARFSLPKSRETID